MMKETKTETSPKIITEKFDILPIKDQILHLEYWQLNHFKPMLYFYTS